MSKEDNRTAAEAFARRVAAAAQPRTTDTDLNAGDALTVLVGLAVSYAHAMNLDFDEFMDVTEAVFFRQAVMRGRVCVVTSETAEA